MRDHLDRPAEAQLDEARIRFEEAWGALNRSIGSEVGGVPRRWKGWALPVAAAAAGLALAFGLKARRRRRKN